MPARKIVNRDVSDQEHTHPSTGRRAVLTGGALTLAAVAGGTLGGAQPASAQTTQPVTALLPANDPTGKKDTANINAAFSALPTITDAETGQTYSVGTVLLAPGPASTPGVFYINGQVTKPPMADLIGSSPGTRINVLGNITGLFSHQPATSGPVQHNTKSGTIANLTIDGTGAGANAIGVDVGDGWGHRLDHLWIQNFTGASAIGLSVCNRQFWTEKFQARHVTLINNTTAVQHWIDVASPPGPQSQEYQDVEYYIWVEPNQNGVIVQGVHWNGSMRVRGNIKKVASLATNAVITLKADPAGAGAASMTGFFDISTEVNASGTNSFNPLSINFADANQGPFFGTGFLRFTGGQTNAAPGQVQFRGAITEGNATLQAVTAPAPFPGSGAQTTNIQNDCTAYITATGGSITKIQVGATAGTLATTGLTASAGQTVPVYLPAGYIISVTYTGTPSWTWISAL